MLRDDVRIFGEQNSYVVPKLCLAEPVVPRRKRRRLGRVLEALGSDCAIFRNPIPLRHFQSPHGAFGQIG